jgi:hypothetical protein
MALNRDEIRGAAAEKVRESVGAEKVMDTHEAEMKLFSIALSARDKARLKIHFKEKGLSLMAGCRMVLLDYLKQEGL